MLPHSTPLAAINARSLQSDPLWVSRRRGFAYDYDMIKSTLLALMLAGPAFAETQADILKAELRPGWRLADGNYMAALDLKLAPDWKTYWRAPGDTGIPPVFDWAGSVNLKSVRFHWPSPKAIVSKGVTSIGYLDQLVLPVEVVPADPSKPVTLALKMDLGICHDICLPAHLKFSGDLSGAKAPDDVILAALQKTPKVIKDANFTCEVAPIADGLRLTARMVLPEQGASETVAFETPDPTVWVASATSDRQGKVLTAQTDLVPPNGAPFALDRSGVVVTVMGDGGAVELHGCPAP